MTMSQTQQFGNITITVIFLLLIVGAGYFVYSEFSKPAITTVTDIGEQNAGRVVRPYPTSSTQSDETDTAHSSIDTANAEADDVAQPNATAESLVTTTEDEAKRDSDTETVKPVVEEQHKVAEKQHDAEPKQQTDSGTDNTLAESTNISAEPDAISSITDVATPPNELAGTTETTTDIPSDTPVSDTTERANTVETVDTVAELDTFPKPPVETDVVTETAAENPAEQTTTPVAETAPSPAVEQETKTTDPLIVAEGPTTDTDPSLLETDTQTSTHDTDNTESVGVFLPAELKYNDLFEANQVLVLTVELKNDTTETLAPVTGTVRLYDTEAKLMGAFPLAEYDVLGQIEWQRRYNLSSGEQKTWGIKIAASQHPDLYETLKNSQTEAYEVTFLLKSGENP